MSSGIYRIVCTVTGKCYIGSAIQLERRWNEHRSQLRRNIHTNRKLQAAWNKHGEKAFVFEIVELVLIPELLTAREQHYLDTLKPVFNVKPNASSSLGYKHSPEVIEKIRRNSTGRKHTSESIAKMSKVQKGHPTSEATRKKIGESQIGRISPNKGKKMTPEQLEHHRLVRIGKKASEETKRKMSEARKGTKRSPETREKMRRAALGHVVSAETRKRISDAKARRSS